MSAPAGSASNSPTTPPVEAATSAPSSPPKEDFKAKLQKFASRPEGYVVFLVLIVLAIAGSLFELGILLGAAVLLIAGFGIPIYLGWNRSYKTLFIVVLVVTVATPPVWGAIANNELFTPYAPGPSADNVLQNATVNPFSYPPNHGTYHFRVDAVRETEGANATKGPINVTWVGLWVTDCPYDGAGQNNGCGENPDYYHNYTYSITPANQSREINIAYFNESLPYGDIIYYVFTANYTMWGGGYNFSCLGYCTIAKGIPEPMANEDIYWNEGPITGSWTYIYGTKILPSYYEVMAVLGGLLAIVVFVYRFLKIRAKKRQDQASASAMGIASAGEQRCPKCNAVVKEGESFCWKCGATLGAPPPATPAESPSQPLK